MRDWEATLGALLHEHGADLFGYAYLLTGSDPQAEALLQEAVTRTFRSGHGSREVSSALADVKRAITAAFLDAARRSPGPPSSAPEAVHTRANDTPLAPASEPDSDLRVTLLTLPPIERACVVLSYLDEVPIEDIAADLKLAEATVERHLADGVGRLRARHAELDFTEVFSIAVADGRSW